jgi:hypothetical protein
VTCGGISWGISVKFGYVKQLKTNSIMMFTGELIWQIRRSWSRFYDWVQPQMEQVQEAARSFYEMM